jgi:glycosyltransferase involved in cell wall biosynthesis
MRVLICIETLGIGGKERQAVELVKALGRRPDIDCLMVCLQSDDFYLHELRNVGNPVEFILRRRRWDVGVFSKLYRTIRRFQPHLIHTYGMMSSFYALPLAKLMRLPLINASIQNAFPRGGWRWEVERLLLKASDYRIANSYAGLWSRHFSEGDCHNVVIVNGFDFSRVERFMTDRSPSRPRGDRAVKIVGMVAEFNRFKDYANFIRAALQISRHRKDVLFVTVGDGETLEASEKLAAGSETIRFLGKHKNIEEIIDTFDIGVLSTFTEGISNSIMEYMALSKPVVATNGGGTRELVVEGETGLLVPAEAPDALAARINYLLDNPDVATRMGAAGEARLRREFSMGRMVEGTVQLYQRALANAAGQRRHRDRRGGRVAS